MDFPEIVSVAVAIHQQKLPTVRLAAGQADHLPDTDFLFVTQPSHIFVTPQA